jgi:hypothetical protein
VDGRGLAILDGTVGVGELVDDGVALGDDVATEITAGAGGGAAGAPTGVNEATSKPPMDIAVPNIRCPHRYAQQWLHSALCKWRERTITEKLPLAGRELGRLKTAKSQRFNHRSTASGETSDRRVMTR